MNSGQVQLFTRIIVWMLQQHLLLQIHTYVILALNDDMKCNWQDPVEKNISNKKPIPVERLDEELKQMELNQDEDTILSGNFYLGRSLIHFCGLRTSFSSLYGKEKA